MRTTKALFLLLGMWGVANADDTPQDTSRWNVRFLRMEGAAVSVRQAADEVYGTGLNVRNNNVLSDLARLRSAADELHRVVRSAELAVAVAASDIDKNREHTTD